MKYEELSCSELVELVTDYLEGALDDEASTQFEEHLVWCPPCVTYLDQMRETIAAAGRLTEDDLSPAARAELMHAFRDWAGE